MLRALCLSLFLCACTGSAAVRAAPSPTEVSESFPNSLTELTDHLLDEELRLREENGERLSHRDKLALVAILNDKGIYPDAETHAKLYSIGELPQAVHRAMTRAWTRVRTGR